MQHKTICDVRKKCSVSDTANGAQNNAAVFSLTEGVYKYTQ